MSNAESRTDQYRHLLRDHSVLTVRKNLTRTPATFTTNYEWIRLYYPSSFNRKMANLFSPGVNNRLKKKSDSIRHCSLNGVHLSVFIFITVNPFVVRHSSTSPMKTLETNGKTYRHGLRSLDDVENDPPEKIHFECFTTKKPCCRREAAASGIGQESVQGSCIFVVRVSVMSNLVASREIWVM